MHESWRILQILWCNITASPKESIVMKCWNKWIKTEIHRLLSHETNCTLHTEHSGQSLKVIIKKWEWKKQRRRRNLWKKNGSKFIYVMVAFIYLLSVTDWMNQPNCCTFLKLKHIPRTEHHVLSFRSAKRNGWTQQKKKASTLPSSAMRNNYFVFLHCNLMHLKNVWTHHIKLFSFHLNECVQFFFLFKWKQMCLSFRSFHAPNFMVRTMIFLVTAHYSLFIAQHNIWL